MASDVEVVQSEAVVGIDFKARRYSILEGRAGCQSCGVWSRVWTFAVPVGQLLVPNDFSGEWEWQRTVGPALLSHVRYVGDPVPERVRALTGCFRVGVGVAGRRYWQSYCEECGDRIDERRLREGRHGVFSSFWKGPPEVVKHWVDEEFVGGVEGVTMFLGQDWFRFLMRP